VSEVKEGRASVSKDGKPSNPEMLCPLLCEDDEVLW
jgi:hypothetical protein